MAVTTLPDLERAASDPSIPRQYTRNGRTRFRHKVAGEEIFIKILYSPDKADKEILGYAVCRAVGALAPAVCRVSDTVIAMTVVPGVHIYNHARPDQARIKMIQTFEGQCIALVDRLIHNKDRIDGNWFKVEDKPWAIDFEKSFDGTFATSGNSVFGCHLDMSRFSTAERHRIHKALQELEPEFAALGREKWHELVMANWRKLTVVSNPISTVPTYVVCTSTTVTEIQPQLTINTQPRDARGRFCGFDKQ